MGVGETGRVELLVAAPLERVAGGELRDAPDRPLGILDVPFSVIGAVWLLWAFDYNVSIAVWAARVRT